MNITRPEQYKCWYTDGGMAMRSVFEWLKVTEADKIIDSMQQDKFKEWYARKAEKEPEIYEIHREVYKDFITMLLQKQPKKTDTILMVEEVFNDKGFSYQTCVVYKSDFIEHWAEQKVISYNAYDFVKDKVPRYAYDLSAREEILGYNIPDTCVEMFEIEKILADVLWEMTFYGISDEDIANESAQLFNEEDSDENTDKDDVWNINEWKQQENDSENKDVKELQEKIEILGNRFAYEMRLKIFDKVYFEIEHGNE